MRTPRNGILNLAIKPKELVYEGDAIATIYNPFGKAITDVRAPFTGIVIGTTTAPIVVPGTGIAHVAKLKKALAMVERQINRRSLDR